MNIQAAATRFEESLDLSGTFIRRTNLNGVNLQNADLSAADCSNATFRGANFTNANLRGTVLKGADLTDVIGLTKEQLAQAFTDKATVLPRYLSGK
jgi:uncharacterized protein YjbI with pentapeptide repeats